MEWEQVEVQGAKIAIAHLGDRSRGDVHFIWAHGWGHSSAQMLSLAESLEGFGASSLIDFPGFGRSSAPPSIWGTADYAEAVAEWLRQLPAEQRIWVGHSFGCRVGIQIAARHPGLISRMVLISAAGLPRRRSIAARARMWLRIRGFKVAKLILKEGPKLDRVRARMGSADYRNAGQLRPILTRVVNENLSDVAAKVACPVLLLYGEADIDTPVEIGERLSKLIPNAQLVVLKSFDHHNILTTGAHQVTRQILRFAECKVS